MQNFQKLLGYGFDTLLALLLGVVASDLLAEAYVHFYAWRLGVPLTDLSEDYGMAMLSFLIQVLSFLGISFAVLFVLVRRRKAKTRACL